MIFKCNECSLIFTRRIDLDRHMNRKVSCSRVLSCGRCGKLFTQISNFDRHMNRRNPCSDIRALRELELKIEQEKTKTEQEKNKGLELELKIEQEKTEQTKPTHIKNGDGDTIGIQNNIKNQNAENMINVEQMMINNYQHEYNKSRSQIEDMIVVDDLVQTIQNFFKNQYNNPEYIENKCIHIERFEDVNKVIAYVKTPDGFKKIGYTEIKPHIKNHIRDQVNDIIDRHTKLTDDEMITYSIPQKDFIEENKIKTVKKIPSYVNNERNNKVVKIQLETALVSEL